MTYSLLYCDAPNARPRNAANEWFADLDIAALVDAMSDGDKFISDTARQVLSESFSTGVEDILYRQEIVQDALDNASAFESLYRTLGKGLAKYDEDYRASQPGYARFSPIVERIRASAALLDVLLTLAGTVRGSLTSGGFSSGGMRRYIQAFLFFYDEAFLKAARKKHETLAGITDGSCVIIGAKLGGGLKGTGYRIRNIQVSKKARRAKNAIELDSVNLQMKAIELRDAAVANVLYAVNAINAQMARGLKQLYAEIGFYVGCARLHRRFDKLGVPVSFPIPSHNSTEVFRFTGLTDAGLALRTGEIPISNALSLDGARLIVITGANQGGKSTFLRSVGCAQVMMHGGLFVTARNYESSAASCVLTHFCRPEDGAMDSGKLDEELKRMNRIVDEIEPYSMLLMNESFASTTESEGSSIAGEITRALYAMRVRVLYVTHLYDYARTTAESGLEGVAMLRADRDEEGGRSFQIQRGLALPTSYGLDLYRRIIETR